MFDTHRRKQYNTYKKAREHFILHPEILVSLERLLDDTVYDLISSNLGDLAADYDEASYLYPFWQNYPPEDRGRMPIGDQYPWIEVGEQVFGNKIVRLLGNRFRIRDIGVPSGPDKRLVLSSKSIGRVCQGYTDACWLFLDIKSVGPRDDQEHAVMSHNQISGDGVWEREEDGIKNKPILAKGFRASHPFHCAIPPLYVLSDATVAPVVNLVVKPVYRMVGLEKKTGEKGQPLHKITIAAIPNGILLSENPAYLEKHPGLFFPGKDDKSKDPTKVRARISFELLRKIDSWRVRIIKVS
jgi:hypothetical protein